MTANLIDGRGTFALRIITEGMPRAGGWIKLNKRNRILLRMATRKMRRRTITSRIKRTDTPGGTATRNRRT